MSSTGRRLGQSRRQAGNQTRSEEGGPRRYSAHANPVEGNPVQVVEEPCEGQGPGPAGQGTLTDPATAGPRPRRRAVASRASADFETVKWIYLRNIGETAAYQLHRAPGGSGGSHGPGAGPF